MCTSYEWEGTRQGSYLAMIPLNDLCHQHDNEVIMMRSSLNNLHEDVLP